MTPHMRGAAPGASRLSSPPPIDPALFARLSAHLDARLATSPLRIARTRDGDARIVVALGVLVFRVRPFSHEVTPFLLGGDRRVRPFGCPFALDRLFAGPFWLRFAVASIAPDAARVDVVADPHDRPGEVELATCGAIAARLRHDARFERFRHAFAAAIAMPAFTAGLMRDVTPWAAPDPATLASAWRTIERTNARLRTLLSLTSR